MSDVTALGASVSHVKCIVLDFLIKIPVEITIENLLEILIEIPIEIPVEILSDIINTNLDNIDGIYLE